MTSMLTSLASSDARRRLTAMTFPGPPIMKVTAVSLPPDPSPARGEGRFVSRIRNFHIKIRSCEPTISTVC